MGHRMYLPQPILRSNLTLGILSLLEGVQEDERPLWLSFSLERPKMLGGDLTLCHSFPGGVRITGPYERQPPAMNNKGAGIAPTVCGGQVGYSGPFVPEEGKKKAPAWLWLLGNIELLTFNILWQA